MNSRVVLANSVPAFLRVCGSSFAARDRATQVLLNKVVVVCSAGVQANPLRVRGPLSVRAVLRGAEHYTVGRRTLCVDEDSYLMINAGHEYLLHEHPREPTEAVTVFFSSETYRAMEAQNGARPAVSDLRIGQERPVMSVGEYLRPHDDLVSPLLRTIMDASRRNTVHEDWYVDQIAKLYACVIEADAQLNRRSAVFEPASPSTRCELLRRVMAATDFVNSNYMRSITLDDMAMAAHLSKFHLARLFRVLHGVSPAAYLRLKRITTAERLIERSDADLSQIAERCGFGSRWSMFRELRRRRGMSGMRIRESWLHSSSREVARPGEVSSLQTVA